MQTRLKPKRIRHICPAKQCEPKNEATTYDFAHIVVKQVENMIVDKEVKSRDHSSVDITIDLAVSCMIVMYIGMHDNMQSLHLRQLQH